MLCKIGALVRQRMAALLLNTKIPNCKTNMLLKYVICLFSLSLFFGDHDKAYWNRVKQFNSYPEYLIKTEQ